MFLGERFGDEGSSVEFSGSVFDDALAVFKSAVAFVVYPVILGILVVVNGHDLITVNFGNDAGSGHAINFGVGFD